MTAGEAPRKAEMKEAVIAMGKKAERLGADIRLNTPVTKELIAEIKPHTRIQCNRRRTFDSGDSGSRPCVCGKFSRCPERKGESQRKMWWSSAAVWSVWK